MSKLKRFKENKNKKNTIKLVMAFLLVAIVSATISYAVYQKTDEVLFINAKVGQFEISSSDIELAMKLDGENIEVPPGKGYYNITIECDNAVGIWDKEKWAAVIENITSNRVKCNVNFETLNVLAAKVDLGDYISMTPIKTLYSIPASLTGYTSNQTINPSELNLWRVIRKNDDGTVDVVSEYVSSSTINFKDKVGYLNFVGGLNVIAAQYINEKYVESTRHIGYNNQIERCTGTISYNNASTCPNDTGYETDINLVATAVGTLIGNTSSGTVSIYWLASRFYDHASHGDAFDGRLITGEGEVSKNDLIHMMADGANGVYGGNNHIRPILTLKSDVQITSGDGNSAATAYQFS